MNSILDILHCLFVGFSLAIAALQRWAGHKVSIVVGFDHDWQSEVFHTRIIEEDDRARRLLVNGEIPSHHRILRDKGLGASALQLSTNH